MSAFKNISIDFLKKKLKNQPPNVQVEKQLKKSTPQFLFRTK